MSIREDIFVSKYINKHLYILAATVLGYKIFIKYVYAALNCRLHRWIRDQFKVYLSLSVYFKLNTHYKAFFVVLPPPYHIHLQYILIEGMTDR